MEQQHYDEINQGAYGRYEEHLPDNKDVKNAYQHPFSEARALPTLGQRFTVALGSIILLVMIGLVNILLEHMLGGILGDPMRPTSLSPLFYALFSVFLSTLFATSMIWINTIVDGWYHAQGAFGEKLSPRQGSLIGQRLALGMLFLVLVVGMIVVASIYLSSGLSFGSHRVMGAWIGALFLFSSGILAGAALWINNLVNRKR